MDGEVREIVVNGRMVIESLARVMKRRSISMDVKKGLRKCSLANLDVWIRNMDME